MKDLDIILKKIYDKVKKIKGGKNASYIPELAKVDPKIYSIYICDINGNIHNIGDYNKEVAIESVAKVYIHLSKQCKWNSCLQCVTRIMSL